MTFQVGSRGKLDSVDLECGDFSKRFLTDLENTFKVIYFTTIFKIPFLHVKNSEK